MRAIFNSTVFEVECAVTRAGLHVHGLPHAEGADIPQSDDVEVQRSAALHTAATGEPHAIMRLIGAFADDGQDCLVSAS